MTTDDGRETTGANKRADGDGEERRYREKDAGVEREERECAYTKLLPRTQGPSTCVSWPGALLKRRYGHSLIHADASCRQ